MYYHIRVFDEVGDTFRDFSITTDKGEEMARLFAFLMDGGSGHDFDDGVIELAKMYTEIVR